MPERRAVDGAQAGDADERKSAMSRRAGPTVHDDRCLVGG